MKNSELLAISNNLNTISVDELSGFPTRIVYAIFKNRENVRQALTTYNATRDAIIRKYSGGTKLDKTDPNFPEAVAEISELAEMEEAVEIRTVSISELDGVEITPQMMDKLIFMIGD